MEKNPSTFSTDLERHTNEKEAESLYGMNIIKSSNIWEFQEQLDLDEHVLNHKDKTMSSRS
jgi:hypothetical protein